MFKADLRGCFIGDNLSLLKILSLHKGVINLLDQKTGHIISLIEKEKNMTAMSLLIPDLFRNFSEPLNQGEIHLDDSTIAYKDSKPWSGCIPKLNYKLSERLNDIEELKKRLDGENSLFALFTNVYKTPYQFKVKEILENKISLKNRTILGLENIIGLGQGMTPSGDDFITGALLGENCFGESFVIEKEIISETMDQTTYAGRTLLYQALRGSFPAYMLKFIEETTRSPGKENIYRAALKASDHGSTSGKDTLAGFYWYCQFMNINYSRP